MFSWHNSNFCLDAGEEPSEIKVSRRPMARSPPWEYSTSWYGLSTEDEEEKVGGKVGSEGYKQG